MVTNTTTPADAFRRRTLGWGLLLEQVDDTDHGRDVRLEARDGRRDLATVSGLPNLAQALSVAMTTLRGSDVFNTEFGFDGLLAMVEETDPIMLRERMRIGVIGTLRRDPRVAKIVDVKLADGRLSVVGDEGLDPVEADAMRRARQLSVRVAFVAISGDEASVDLGKPLTSP